MTRVFMTGFEAAHLGVFPIMSTSLPAIDTTAPIDRTLSVKAYYRPRRLGL